MCCHSAILQGTPNAAKRFIDELNQVGSIIVFSPGRGSWAQTCLLPVRSLTYLRLVNNVAHADVIRKHCDNSLIRAFVDQNMEAKGLYKVDRTDEIKSMFPHLFASSLPANKIAGDDADDSESGQDSIASSAS